MEVVQNKSFRDSLSTTDEFGNRVRVIPASTSGHFARLRIWIHCLLVAIFLFLPWVTISGNPALQIDIAHRRFFILGHLFLPQDIPGIVFILGAFVLSIGTLTALYGRAWCGWACPQTVFIEAFFRRVERWIEGDHLAQRKLDRSHWNFDKFLKRTSKWLVFLFGTLIITHSFLAYFVGPSDVLQMVTHSPFENPGSFILVLITSLIILFDFGWFREQFCLIACPYGRLQSALMDEGSFTIAYDSNRKDCIDCFKCVQVCPTGIDIRNGLQMECIACTACADACDFVMKKIKKPSGLIRYESESGLQGNRLPVFRTRVYVYLALLTMMLVGLFYRIQTQEILQTESIRAVDFPYQLIRSESGTEQVINHFKVNWYNLSGSKQLVSLSLSDSITDKEIELIQSGGNFEVEVGGKKNHQFFLKFPMKLLKKEKQSKIKLQSIWKNEVEEITKKEFEVKLVGPGST